MCVATGKAVCQCWRDLAAASVVEMTAAVRFGEGDERSKREESSCKDPHRIIGAAEWTRELQRAALLLSAVQLHTNKRGRSRRWVEDRKESATEVF